jgi:hypothetical protein
MTVQPGAGGAAIADRFKLDAAPVRSATTGTISKKAALSALVAGLVCLALAGVLTFMLYDHWAYFKSA